MRLWLFRDRDFNNTIIISGTSAHEYLGEQSKYKYKFWCKFCCWPPFTVIASLVPRKLLIFPLNFGLSYFVLVLVFSLSASELASASLLVPNYIFGVIRSYIYVWFSIFTLLVACKKSFACCCCNFFHPRYFVYRSLSIFHIDVVRRRMFLRPGPQIQQLWYQLRGLHLFCVKQIATRCKHICLSFHTHLSECFTKRVRPLHNNTSTQTCCVSLQTRLSTLPVPFQTCLSARLVNENWIQTTLTLTVIVPAFGCMGTHFNFNFNRYS